MKFSHFGIKLSVGVLILLIIITNLIYWHSVSALSSHMTSLVSASNHLESGDIFHSSVHSMMMDVQGTPDKDRYIQDRKTADSALKKLKGYYKGKHGIDAVAKPTEEMAIAYYEFREITDEALKGGESSHAMMGMHRLQVLFDSIFEAYQKLHSHHTQERRMLLSQTEVIKKQANIMVFLQLFIAGVVGIFVIFYLERVVLKIYDITENLALHDKLTGLYNRHALERIVSELDKPSQKKEKGFGIILIDIDYFKKFNDTYGHSAGDILLKRLAKLLGAVVRKQDRIVRFGGEEILVILSWVDRIGTQKVAEKIRGAVEKEQFDIGSSHPPQTVTVSIGYSASSFDTGSFDDLLNLADKRLYTAKNEGRNRVSGS